MDKVLPAWIPIFADPLPDETLHSVISRSFINSSFHSSSAYLTKLFGAKHAITATGLPSRIQVLTQCLKQNTVDISEDYIINNLTLYSYYSTFLSQASATLLAHKMLSTDGRSIKISTGLVAHGLGAAEPLRLCHSCRRDDFAKYGQPYWHRSHQLPCVTVCHIHKEPLYEISGPAHLTSRHLLILPTKASITPFRNYRNSHREGNPQVNRLAIEFAEWSHQLLFSQLISVSFELLRAAYLQRLIEIGLATTSGRVKQTELTEYILHFHNNFKYFNEKDHLTIHTTSELPWAARLVRKPRATQHPIHHILLGMAIYDHWDSYAKEVLNPRPINILPTFNTTNDTTTKTIKNLIETQHYSLTKTAEQVGLSVTTVAIIAKQFGLNITTKPKHIDKDKIERTLILLAQGEPLPTIAKLLHLSPPSIRRILRIYPEIANQRETFLFAKEKVLRQKKLADKIKLRQLNDRQSIRKYCYRDITWLRRHNRAWLTEFLSAFPPTNKTKKERISWELRDSNYLHDLKLAQTNILTRKGKPIRITKNELGRVTGKQDWIDKHLEKLPRCRLFISNIVESTNDFRARCNALDRHELPRYRSKNTIICLLN